MRMRVRRCLHTQKRHICTNRRDKTRRDAIFCAVSFFIFGQSVSQSAELAPMNAFVYCSLHLCSRRKKRLCVSISLSLGEPVPLLCAARPGVRKASVSPHTFIQVGYVGNIACLCPYSRRAGTCQSQHKVGAMCDLLHIFPFVGLPACLAGCLVGCFVRVCVQAYVPSTFCLTLSLAIARSLCFENRIVHAVFLAGCDARLGLAISLSGWLDGWMYVCVFWCS
mmetsp:Transcript_49469/g.124069  ORF Transcript_49469/g.124069 Transcript_49469/m.124069 type:complete len:223 (-) Transcript_49469:980-1648(-)